MAAPASIRVATAIGITSSALVSGGILGVSFLGIPPLLQSPSPLLAQQWRTLFKRGASIAPPLAITSTVAYIYIAIFRSRQLLHPRLWGFRVAGLLTLSIVPYTILLMNKTNSKLMAKAEELGSLGVGEGYVEAGIGQGESVKELVDWWATLNVGRGALPLFGTLFGLWAVLG